MERHGQEPDRVGEGEVRKPNILEAFRVGTGIDRALRRAVHEALRKHKQLGHSVVVGRDGKVVLIPADQIPVED
jgi:hypothetical protein